MSAATRAKLAAAAQLAARLFTFFVVLIFDNCYGIGKR